MMIVKEIRALVSKDIRFEFRQRSAVNGIVLYVVAVIFICYLSFMRVGIVDAQTWNALYWIILMFASMNAASKTFVMENTNRQYYYYTLASPRAIILSKIIYNTVFVFILSLLSFFLYVLFMGNKAENEWMFLVGTVLGSIGISVVLTFVSAISSRTNNNFTLMAVLGFPLMLPVLLVLMHISEMAVSGQGWMVSWPYFLLVILIDAIVLVLALILFPYLWHD
jgi:heme exporter protein B